jgi:hypothetical protein
MKQIQVAISTTINQSTSNQYDKYWIEILLKDSNGIYSKIGNITFQGTVEERNKRHDYWYGMSVDINTSVKNHKHLSHMAAICKIISDNADYNAQPEEILKVINAEEYVRGYGWNGFVPKRYIGMNVYKVMDSLGRLYSYEYAANDIVANKLLSEKKYKDGNYTIHFVDKFTAIW